MKKLDKNSKVLIILTFIFFIFVISVSFALPDFIVNLQGININKLNSCKLNVVLSDEDAINLVNTFPMSDTDALKNTPYKVTLTKEGNCEGFNFILSMKSSCDDCTKTDGKCTIGENTCDCNNQIDSNLIKYYVKNNNTDKVYTGNNPYNMNITGTFSDTDEDITFDILLWIDKDATNDDLYDSEGNAKDFCSKLGAKVGDATIPEGSALKTIASQVKTANISYKYINDANVTIDGIAYNVDDNGVFLYDGTDDNAGLYPIYYYRGNVTNNNVLFANMCWKIVRTTSTGGIKLIYNGLPSEDGTCDNTGEDSSIGDSKFNSNYNSPADIGYMYGERYEYEDKNIDSVTDTIIYGNDVIYDKETDTYKLTGKTMTSTAWYTDYKTIADGYHYTCFSSETTCSSVYYITYFSSHAYYLTFTEGDNLDTAKEKMFTNTNDSAIKTTIDNWYKDNLTDYTSYLENTIFCNNRSSASDEAYTVTRNGTTYIENGGPLSSKDIYNIKGYSDSYFKSYENTGKGTPSLQCTNKNDRFSLKTENGGTSEYGNNALTYPVGLLTSDEVNLAGGQYTSNYNYYLVGSAYWVLSPAFWNGTRSSVVLGANNLDWKYVGQSSYSVRPVISLKSGVAFEEDSLGTTDNPYKVID